LQNYWQLAGVTFHVSNMSDPVVFWVKNEVYYSLRYNITRVANVKMIKWKRRKKPDEQLNLSIIENANKAMKNVYCLSQWIMIHQGNDSY
jgi:hypothetical protein